MKKYSPIYFDHQATTPIFSNVFNKMRPFFTNLYANPHSSDHAMGWAMDETIQNSRHILSKFSGCDEDEFIFTSGATESNNLAILGVGRGSFPPTKNRILISSVEHKCVLAACDVLSRQHGMIIERIPVDKTGTIDQSAFRNMINDDVRLVSVMAVNNEIGTLQDVQSIGRISHKHGALFHCDAAQAPLAMHCPDIFKAADLISLSGHKMYGPKGIGALIIRREYQNNIEPLIYGGEQQNGLRAGTLPTPLCVGFAAAASEISKESTKANIEELRHLRDLFVTEFLKIVRGASLNGPQLSNRHPGNANFLLGDRNGSDFLNRLQPHVAASTGSACTSGLIGGSHVLEAIGLTKQQAQNSVRFSLGLGSSADEVRRAIMVIAES